MSDEVDLRDLSEDAREHYEDMERLERIRLMARELGRRGGLKGGCARAAALSKERRREIASNAARVRWGRVASPSGESK